MFKTGNVVPVCMFFSISAFLTTSGYETEDSRLTIVNGCVAQPRPVNHNKSNSSEGTAVQPTERIFIDHVYTEMSMKVRTTKSIEYHYICSQHIDASCSKNITFGVSTFGIINVTQEVIVNIPCEIHNTTFVVPIIATHAGKTKLFIDKVNGFHIQNDTGKVKRKTSIIDVSKSIAKISVYLSDNLILLSDIIGWIYFSSWSLSFYPQIYQNWKSQSVIGLNFDFLALNFIGYICYSAYNIGLFAIPLIGCVNIYIIHVCNFRPLQDHFIYSVPIFIIALH